MLDFVPDYLQGSHFWKSIWPIALLPALLSAAFAYLITRRRRFRPLLGTYVVALFAFSLIGIVIGNITGLSRNPAVAATVPAILTLIGGVLAYVIGTKGIGQQRLVAAGLICLSFSLVVGVMWGSRARVIFEYEARAFEASLAALASAKPDPGKAEDALLRTALRKMQNEVTFLRLKAGLEKKYNIVLKTAYPAQQETGQGDKAAPDR